MKQTFKSRLRRVAAAALFSQPILTESAVYAAEPKAAGSPVKVAEQNPFDGLCTSKHSTKISDYNANVMEVEISGEKYLAYCLNPNRYGSDNVSGGAVGSSGYSVQVYDLDDPALQNVPDFQLDQSILLAMQGVIASGGYTGGGDAAAGKLMDPYDASRPLYRDHLQAYAVTKYAMWSLASGWYGPDWKVYSGSSYKPQDNAYLLQSLTNIIGWGTNWKEFNDENLYVNPMDYESAAHHNAVFVGRDESGVPRYVFLRGTCTLGKPFKCEAAGSDKRYSFCLSPEGESRRAAIYEAAVETLAHLTLEGRADKYRLSLGGVCAPREGEQRRPFKTPPALDALLARKPEIQEIEICLNNDFAGRWAAEHIARAYQDRYRIIQNLPEREGCDYADLAQEKREAARSRAAFSR